MVEEMRKYFFTALVIFAAAPAMAQQDEDDDSTNIGCSALGGGVAAGVHYVLTQGGANVFTHVFAGTIAAGAGAATYEGCDRTTEEVSRSFFDALNVFGFRIRWGAWGAPSAGLDYEGACLSMILSQCYPTQDPDDDTLWSPAQAAFIMDMWDATREGINSMTPFGLGGDLTNFSANDFGNAFHGSVQNNVFGSMAEYEAGISLTTTSISGP